MDQDKPTKKRGDAKPKIDFVLRLPLDMPAAEVSAKAKEAGLEIKSGYVHTIRSAAKKAKQGGGKTVSAAPKSKAAKPVKASRRKPSKTSFILGLPWDMPAAEVVAKAAAAGLKISVHYVYSTRSSAAKAAKSGKTTAKVHAQKPVKAPVAPKRLAKQPKPLIRVDGPTSEVLLRKLVLELGLKRSRDLLDEVERKLGDLIAGK